jgi:hypothetical protein
MASMQMTVTDKVLSCLRENTGQGPVSVAGTDPAWAKELSEFELDLRDWGVVYGMAFGIARSEQPFETLEAAAERAYDPAQLALGRVVRPRVP